ncbi:hypothetical protein D3C81_2210030 [compost metagenome]
MSNSWLKDEGLMSWVYRMTIKGVQDLMANKKAYVRYEDWAQRQLKGKVIRTEDIKYVLNKLGVELPPVKIA